MLDAAGSSRLHDHVGIPIHDSLKVVGAARIGVHVNDLPNPSPAEVETSPVGE